MNSSKILVVDDETEMRSALSETVRQLGYSVLVAPTAESALEQCEPSVDLILADIRMPGMSGIDLMEELRNRGVEVPTILMSAYGTIQSAVDAMKAGACDYLVKPFSCEILETAIANVFGTPSTKLSSRYTERRAGPPIITEDPSMIKLLRMAEIVAASPTTVMIEGESGTGKELLARYVHENSPRAHRPFIAVNCAAVPEALLESELFGFEKGAFTGATVRKAGRFELAHTGTILLDEISEMQISLQAKLLRVIQEREIDPLGGKGPIPLDLRIIATTNRPLWEEVKNGRFREDLYYRLNVFPLYIPPIRLRTRDIPLLVHHFMEKSNLRSKRKTSSITEGAMALLSNRTWRGNVRELENVMERASLLAGEGTIKAEHLQFLASNPSQSEPSRERPATLWESERELILTTLDRFGGNRTHAARRLGISIRTLRNKLRDYRSLDTTCPGREVE